LPMYRDGSTYVVTDLLLAISRGHSHACYTLQVGALPVPNPTRGRSVERLSTRRPGPRRRSS
jgi:hypothetical protein